MRRHSLQIKEGRQMIRVGAFQGIPAATLDERIDQIKDVLQQAERECIDFLCFPEGFLTGYYPDRKVAEQNSIKVEDSIFQNFLQQTVFSDVTFIIGFNEQEDDKIYDSAAIIERGKLLGIQRKHFLYHDYFTPDDRFCVFQSKGIPFGVVICLDTNYFEPSRLLALQGAAILFAPLCNKVALEHPYASRPPYYSHFVARAHENRCWLIAADWIWPNDGQTICPGHSVIYDPDGREIIRSQEGKQQLIMTEISKDQLLHEKGRRVRGSSVLIREMSKLTLGSTL